jgi:hypothetical protein
MLAGALAAWAAEPNPQRLRKALVNALAVLETD